MHLNFFTCLRIESMPLENDRTLLVLRHLSFNVCTTEPVRNFEKKSTVLKKFPYCSMAY